MTALWIWKRISNHAGALSFALMNLWIWTSQVCSLSRRLLPRHPGAISIYRHLGGIMSHQCSWKMATWVASHFPRCRTLSSTLHWHLLHHYAMVHAGVLSHCPEMLAQIRIHWRLLARLWVAAVSLMFRSGILLSHHLQRSQHRLLIVTRTIIQMEKIHFPFHYHEPLSLEIR